MIDRSKTKHLLQAIAEKHIALERTDIHMFAHPTRSAQWIAAAADATRRSIEPGVDQRRGGRKAYVQKTTIEIGMTLKSSLSLSVNPSFKTMSLLA